jgi:hypothetical protein
VNEDHLPILAYNQWSLEERKCGCDAAILSHYGRTVLIFLRPTFKMGSATALALRNTWRNCNKKECREKVWSTAFFADLGHSNCDRLASE